MSDKPKRNASEPLSFDSCAEYVALRFKGRGRAEAERVAGNFERNLGWDAQKLLISAGVRAA